MRQTLSRYIASFNHIGSPSMGYEQVYVTKDLYLAWDMAQKDAYTHGLVLSRMHCDETWIVEK